MSTQHLHREMAAPARAVLEAKAVLLGELLLQAHDDVLAALPDADSEARAQDALSVVSQLAALAAADLMVRLSRRCPAATDRQIITAGLADIQLRVLVLFEELGADVVEGEDE